MIKTTRLPEDFIAGTAGTNSSQLARLVEPMVEKRTLEGIDEIQHLYIFPWTSIKKHGHNEQWELWLRFSPNKRAYVCLKGEKHKLINNSSACLEIMAIKGHINYSYDDLAQFLFSFGFSSFHGSLVVDD